MYRIARNPEAFNRKVDAHDPDRSESYLKWIRSLPCIVCQAENGIIAHHVRLERGPGGILKSDNMLGKRKDRPSSCSGCHSPMNLPDALGESLISTAKEK